MKFFQPVMLIPFFLSQILLASSLSESVVDEPFLASVFHLEDTHSRIDLILSLQRKLYDTFVAFRISNSNKTHFLIIARFTFQNLIWNQTIRLRPLHSSQSIFNSDIFLLRFFIPNNSQYLIVTLGITCINGNVDAKLVLSDDLYIIAGKRCYRNPYMIEELEYSSIDGSLILSSEYQSLTNFHYGLTSWSQHEIEKNLSLPSFSTKQVYFGDFLLRNYPFKTPPSQLIINDVNFAISTD